MSFTNEQANGVTDAVSFGKGGCWASWKCIETAADFWMVTAAFWPQGLNAQWCGGAPGTTQAVGSRESVKMGGKRAKFVPKIPVTNTAGLLHSGESHPALCFTQCLQIRENFPRGFQAQESTLWFGNRKGFFCARLRAPTDLPLESSCLLFMTSRQLLVIQRKVHRPLKFYIFPKGWFNHRRNKILAIGCQSLLA